jgi:hypothetical protein
MVIVAQPVPERVLAASEPDGRPCVQRVVAVPHAAGHCSTISTWLTCAGTVNVPDRKRCV